MPGVERVKYLGTSPRTDCYLFFNFVSPQVPTELRYKIIEGKARQERNRIITTANMRSLIRSRFFPRRRGCYYAIVPDKGPT